MSEADLPQVEEKLKKSVEDILPFQLQLQKVCLGPSPHTPRLLWITANCPPELLALKENLNKAFAPHEAYAFLPHITLAQFKMELPNKIRTNVNPEEQLNLEMKVNAVTLFESRSQEKVKYSVLTEFILKKSPL